MGIDFSSNNPDLQELNEQTKDENVLSSEVGRYYNEEDMTLWEKYIATNESGDEILKTRIYNLDKQTREDADIAPEVEKKSIQVTEESMSPILRDIQKKTQDKLLEDLDS